MNVTQGLDFTVQLKDLQTTEGIRSDKKAVVRIDTNEAVGTVSADYRLIQHRDVIKRVSEAIGSVGAFELVHQELAKKGARFFGHFRATEGKWLTDEDKVFPELIITNSYDGSLKLGVELGAYRFVCSNGLRIGDTFLDFKFRHTGNLNLDGVIQTLHQGYDRFQDAVWPRWERMLGIRVPVWETIKKVEEDLQIPKKLGKAVAAKCVQNNEIEKSAWDLYNDFTYFITRDAKSSYDRKRELSRIVDRTFQTLCSVQKN